MAGMWGRCAESYIGSDALEAKPGNLRRTAQACTEWAIL